MATIVNDYFTHSNQNLNSLLSQIQDDGPAQGRVARKTAREKKFKEPDAVQQQREAYADDDTVAQIHTDVKKRRFTKSRSNGKKNVRNGSMGLWLLSLMTICITTTLVFALYTIDLRTSELEASLISFDTSFQDTAVAQQKNDDLSRSLTTTHQALESIQQELQFLQTDYEVLDEQYTESIGVASGMKQKEVITIRDSVGELRRDLLTIKNDLKSVKSKLANNVGTSISASSSIAPKGFTVHLASLSNKIKADKFMKQIRADGFQADLYPARINNKHVYRLSVSGFTEFKDAESFKHKAGKRYGLSDGWIRKN